MVTLVLPRLAGRWRVVASQDQVKPRIAAAAARHAGALGKATPEGHRVNNVVLATAA